MRIYSGYQNRHVQQLSLTDMKPNAFKYESFNFQLAWRDQTCIIQVKQAGSPYVFEGKYNNDTIPEKLSMLFNAKELYQTIVEDPSIVIIRDPLTFEFDWVSGKSKKRIQLPLSQRQQSNQAKAIRQLRQARQSEDRMRQQLTQVRRALLQKEEEVQMFKLALNECKEINTALRKGADALVDMEKQLTKLRIDLKNKDDTIAYLLSEGEKSHARNNMMMSQDEEMKMMLIQQSVMFQSQFQEKQLLGTHLMFKPLQGSVNSAFYTFKDGVIRRNNEGLTGSGKFLACANPIPKTGLLSYQFQVKNATDSPNFKIGLYWNSNPATLQYIFNNDITSISYYCSKLMTPEIENRGNRIPAFVVGVGQSITMTIDWEKQELRFYLNGQFKIKVPLGVYLLDQSKKIYCFVQMWNNGDSLMAI